MHEYIHVCGGCVCVSRNKRSATAYLVTFTFASFATVCLYNVPRKLHAGRPGRIAARIKVALVALLCQNIRRMQNAPRALRISIRVHVCKR